MKVMLKIVRPLLFLALFSTVAFFSVRAQITTDFFGNQIASPIHPAFTYPSSVSTATYPTPVAYKIRHVRSWQEYGCVPSIPCNSGNNYNSGYMWWSQLNPSKGVYQWGLFDSIITRYKNEGVEDYIYTIVRPPLWTTANRVGGSVSTGGNSANLAPDSMIFLKRFLDTLLRRATMLGNPIKFLEIWNEPEANGYSWKEPNDTTGWGRLVDIGQTVYTTAKAYDPTITVLSPSCQGSGADYWLTQYLKTRIMAKNTFDVVSYHGYINFYNGGINEKFETLINKLISLKTAYGISSKPLWDTEGFDAFSAGVQNTSPYTLAKGDTQAAYLAQRYLISGAKGVARVYWYDVIANNGRQTNNVNITHNSGTFVPNEIMLADAVVQKWMTGATVSNLQINTTTGVYSVDITKSGVTNRAVWTRTINKTYNVGPYTQYETIYGTTSNISGSIATIGMKPILLKNVVGTKRAFYLSANAGNDTYAGTIGAPLKTFAKAYSLASASGDSILYKAGENFLQNNAYISGKSVYIGSYGTGSKPVINGGVDIPISSLVDAGGGWRYYTHSGFGASLKQFSIDGRPQEIARFPANSFRKIHSHSGTSYIIDTTLSELGKNFTGFEIVIRPKNWQYQRAYIWKHNGDTLFIQTAAGQKALTYPIADGGGYFVQGGKIDNPHFGSWYYDATNKRIYFYQGLENPSNHVYRVPIYDNAFNVSQPKITFQNLRFSNYNRWAIIKGSIADSGAVLNCEFDNNGEAGLYLVDQKGWKIWDNNFHDNQNIHFKLLESSDTSGCRGTSVLRNSFLRTGILEGNGYHGDPMFSAFYVGGDSSTIQDNYIDSAGYNGSHTKGFGHSILRNNINNTGITLADGAGIYNYGRKDSLKTNPPKTRIAFNRVLYGWGTKAGLAYTSNYDTTNANGKFGGIYLDENSDNVEVDNNTLGFFGWAGIILNGSHNTYVHNNNIFKAWRGLSITDFNSNAAMKANNNRFVSNTVSVDSFSNVDFLPSPNNNFIEFLNFYQRTPSTILFSDSNKFYTFLPTTGTLFFRQYLAAYLAMSFTAWKTYTGGDANSTISQKSAHRFFTNPTAEAVLPSWDSYTDGSGATLTGLLPAYSSVIGFNPGAAPQTISFAALPTMTYGVAPFTLTATASSGLPVSFVSSNTGVATVSGNTVTVVGAGTTTITASQEGNSSYLPATNVSRTLTVLKAGQTISFGSLPVKILGDTAFTLTATASSGLPVTYVSSNPSVVSISGNTATVVGLGSATITASQAGNNNYNAAASVGQVLSVLAPADVYKWYYIVTPDGKKWVYNGKTWVNKK